MNNLLRIKLIMGLALFIQFQSSAQSVKLKMDLAEVNNPNRWEVYNRQVKYENGVASLNGQPKDGLVWNKDLTLFDGTIEVDIKGKNQPGRSFVGIAFHGLSEEKFEAIYFRPFNFKSPTKKGYSVQYISHPDFSWPKLRKEYPNVYESAIEPAPEPDEWFHVRIEIKAPNIEVYINNSSTPSLKVKQLGDQQMGFVGLWAGNNSEAWFKNLTITKKKRF